jgi:hypothetical protein
MVLRGVLSNPPEPLSDLLYVLTDEIPGKVRDRRKKSASGA